MSLKFIIFLFYLLFIYLVIPMNIFHDFSTINM